MTCGNAVLGLAVLAATTAAFGGEKVDTSRHPWARFNVGTFVEMTNATVTGDAKTAAAVKTSLIRKDDKEVALRTEITVKEQTVPKDEVIRLDQEPRFNPAAKDAGREKVAIEGKEYDCRVYELAGEAEGMKTSTRQWVHETLGEMKVVSTSTDKNGTIEASLAVTRLSDELKVGEKPYKCRVMEGKTKSAVGEQMVKMWYCDDVPGRLVRSESRGEVGGVSVTSTTEMTKFEVK